MKNILYTLILFITFQFIQTIELNAQNYNWARSKNNSEGIGLSIDANANTYVTGYFQGTITFGKTELTSFGSFDIYITKYNSDGKFLWAKQAGGSGFDCGKGIAVDSAGNSYVIGSFRDTASFGNIQLIGFGSDDIFISKYDPNGNCLWAQKAGGNNQDDCLGIAIDQFGNSYITGYFQDTATFGSTILLSPGTRELYIAKYDSHGNCLWAKQNSVGNQCTGLGISVDVDKNIYVTGSFQGPAQFGTTKFNSLGKSDIFISKYDSDGNCLWGQKAGGSSQDVGYGIAVDEKSNSYTAGLFEGPAQFGTKQLHGFGKQDIFLSKYDTHGNCVWVIQASGIAGEFARGISIDSKGNSYITGSFRDSAAFDTTHLTGPGGVEVFSAKYDHNGKCLWAQQGGTNTNNNCGNSIAVDSYGNSYVTGRIQGVAFFGTIQLTGTNRTDTFIAKYDSTGKCIWAILN